MLRKCQLPSGPRRCSVTRQIVGSAGPRSASSLSSITWRYSPCSSPTKIEGRYSFRIKKECFPLQWPTSARADAFAFTRNRPTPHRCQHYTCLSIASTLVQPRLRRLPGFYETQKKEEKQGQNLRSSSRATLGSASSFFLSLSSTFISRFVLCSETFRDLLLLFSSCRNWKNKRKSRPFMFRFDEQGPASSALREKVTKKNRRSERDEQFLVQPSPWNFNQPPASTGAALSWLNLDLWSSIQKCEGETRDVPSLTATRLSHPFAISSSWYRN